MRKLYTIIFLLLACAITLKAQVSEQEFLALKALYNATDGDHWTNRTGWENINTTATKDDVTTAWKGIDVIENGHVTGIEFGNNNLVGNVPTEIGNLTALRWLDLGSNKLNGPLPNSMANLINLESIRFSHNLFTCDFPAYIFTNLSKLMTVNMYNCGFGGTLGDIFATLPSLMTFDVSKNNLTGEIPSSINNLKNLSEIHFDENFFSGELPTFDSCANSMYYLTFSANQFSGSIPETYSNFTRLQYLHFDSNQLSGIIPAGLFNPSLRRIYLQLNYFSFSGIEPVYIEIKNLAGGSDIRGNIFPLTQIALSVNAGDALSLSATALSVYDLGGNNNRYKWFRNDEEVYSGNSPIYNVTSTGSTDAGVYRFEVTNTVVTGLTLKSDNITVSVLGTNQPPTDIVLSPSSIDENTIGLVGTLTSTDPDAGDIHTYTKATGNGINDRDNYRISIAGNQLSLTGTANFEVLPTLNVLITDDDGNGGIFTKALTIKINDVNEAPVFNGQVMNNTIDENMANGSTVLTLNAQDPEGTPIIFSIIQGNDDGAFGISNNHLVVADNTKLNYTVNKTYSLVVNASDGNLSENATLTINLNKINQLPIIDDAVFTIDENMAVGTVVGSIVASDPNGDPITLSIIEGNQLGTFALSGNNITVANAVPLNFETNPTFNLTINVTDGVSNVLATINVNLNNLSDESGNDILSFNVPGMVGQAVINSTTHTISAIISKSDITALQADYTISNGASSNLLSGSTINFLTPQSITITSETGASQVWVVSVNYPVSAGKLNTGKVKIYPNPTCDYLILSAIPEGSSIKLVTLLGNIVKSTIAEKNVQTIDVWDLGKGIYYIVVENSTGMISRKIVVK